MSNLATIVNNILADSGIDDINVVVTTGSYNNPAWITALGWSKISGTPTTLAGYGITNAYTKTEVDTLLNAKQNTLTLTTTGSSGASTLVGATLNIPTYTLSGLGGVPTSRTLTINGVTYDLSADRSWTIAAGVTSVSAGTGISVNQTTGAVTVTNTGVLSINGNTGSITGIATESWTSSFLHQGSGGAFVDLDTNKDSKYVTFDQSSPVGAPAADWFNGFISTHSNYLSSYIINQHRTGNWYLGWRDGTTALSSTWRLILHSGNYNSYAPTLTGGGASGTWGINITGDAGSLDGIDSTGFYRQWTAPGAAIAPATGLNAGSAGWTAFDGYGGAVPNYPAATNQWWVGLWQGGDASRGIQLAGGYADTELYFRKGSTVWGSWVRIINDQNYTSYAVQTTSQSNWNSYNVIANVVGLLAWKNYGSNHVIFDASQSTSPSGTSVNNTNAQNAWTGTYPTLMGWNGTYTYGVRVDSARISDNTSGNSATTSQTNFTTLTLNSATVATQSWVNSQGFVTGGPYLPLSGGTLTGTLFFSNNIGTCIRGTMGVNDFWRIYADGGDNSGYLEIATADDGAEPIYISQYSGAFTTLTRRITLLDGSGNTTFPGTVNVSGGVNVSGNSTWFSGQATLAFENQSTFARFAFYGLSLWDWDHGEQMVLNGNYVYVNNYLQAGNSLRAPIFYDSAEPGYYLDPNGFSNIKALSVGGGYTQYGTATGSPSENFGNGRIFMRVWPTGSGSRIMSFKMMISATWNWADAFGFISADVSFYFDGSGFYNATTTITSATGSARVNLGVGNPVIEGGYVSIPIYSVNTNNIFIKLEGAPSFDYSVITFGSWQSVAFPGAAVVNVPGSMNVSSLNVGSLTVSGTSELTGRVNIGNSLSRPSALNSDAVAQARIGGADVHLYVASLGAGGAYRVAMQAARTSDFASFGLDLQSNGGTLYYGGVEVVRNTGTWSINVTGTAGSETLSTVTGRGNTTGSNIITSANVYGNAFYYYSDNAYYINPGSSAYLRGPVQVTGGHNNSLFQVLLRADENGASTGQVTLRAWCSEPGVSWDWAGFGYNVQNDGASPYGFGRINGAFGQAYMRFNPTGQLRFYNTNTSGTRVETAIFAENGTVSFNYDIYAYASRFRVGRHIDAMDTWTSGILSLFLGWYGGKVILGNNNNSGHDYASGLGANTVVVTNAFYCYLSATASSFFESSDMRLKELVEDNHRVAEIQSIKPRLYRKNGKEELGYYAQDVQPMMSYAVSVNEDGYLNLSYREVHTAKIAYLEDSIEEIKAKILYLENQLKTKQ